MGSKKRQMNKGKGKKCLDMQNCKISVMTTMTIDRQMIFMFSAMNDLPT